jgi:hypothetical protein
LRIDVRARDRSGAWNGLRLILRGLGALLALLFVTSCGSNIFIVGTQVATLTTERGHFTSYIVSIDQIYVTRSDGTIGYVSTQALRVDLAQISSHVNLMNTSPLQQGTYVSATIVLDYSAPYITVDYDGQFGPTTVLDAATGAAPGQETFTINFDPNHPLTIGNQTSSQLNFNIDLEASNTINFSNGLPATVTIHPVVSVTSTPVYTKPVLTRGIFVFTDTTNGNFVMNTRPLHDEGITTNGQTFGALTVIPNAQTYWNIDGVPYTGAAGLAQLAKMQSQTASLQIGAIGTGNGQPAPFGNLSGDTPTFAATEVYVGSSLESTVEDHIQGIVAGISAGTVNILGCWTVDRIGNPTFVQTLPVTVVANSTVVSADGNANVPNALSSISVGQFVDISGQLLDTNGNLVYAYGTTPVKLDATFGQVRIQPTTLWANLNSTASGTANVSLDWVAHYEPFDTAAQPPTANFNFAGTGTSTSADATATNYIINTGSLTVPTSPTGALFPGLLQIVGTANTFGQGPPYFTATSITDASALPQQIILEWPLTSYNPFPTGVYPTGLNVNLQDPHLLLHVLRTGPSQVDINSLPNLTPGVLTIVPSTASGSQFSIGNITTGQYVYGDPTGFANKVIGFIAGGDPTYKLVATGQYNPSTGSFTATNIEISVR